MEPNVPSKTELQFQANEGRPVTQDEASPIASVESTITERGPIKGGPAATAQSLHDRQQNFLEKAGDVARKPADEVTQEDAAQVQKAEARAVGGPLGKGSTSADVQSIAAENEKAGRV
ncbi:hypothetical protein DL764_008986 [Monosporascus ibericus]|uniref:SMP domain-containing protein n=1 Tax=Monosporascus ibericus TaxID=155417 RepID=A0A4Q4SYC8_9PEZI|nr:hypothetical protein DL764_008986 [Monosporascus ibericus]